MNVALLEAKWQLVLVYLDYIVVFCRSASKQIDNMKHVLMLKRDTGVT